MEVKTLIKAKSKLTCVQISAIRKKHARRKIGNSKQKTANNEQSYDIFSNCDFVAQRKLIAIYCGFWWAPYVLSFHNFFFTSTRDCIRRNTNFPSSIHSSAWWFELFGALNLLNCIFASSSNFKIHKI